MSQYVQDLLLGGVITLMTWPQDASGLASENTTGRTRSRTISSKSAIPWSCYSHVQTYTKCLWLNLFDMDVMELFLVERPLLYDIIMLKHELYATSRWRSRSSA